jgi:signal transduction histidine kinase
MFAVDPTPSYGTPTAETANRDTSSRRTIADLITHDLRVDVGTPVGRVIKLFEKNPDFDAVAVVGGEYPRMVSRPRFFRELGKRFGYALLEKQPVAAIAEDGSTAKASADPVGVVAIALERETARIYDDILVVDGNELCGLVSFRALMSHHKDLLVRSIAERGVLEDRARGLEELNRMQSEFMSNMTHELRTPVNTILGLVELLKGEDSLSASHSKHLNVLSTRAAELGGIINNILDRHRLDAGALLPDCEEVDVFSLLEEMFDAFEPMAIAKGLGLRIHFAQALKRPFPTDLAFVRRIVTNLLSNAIKFTPFGTVTLFGDRTQDLLTLGVSDTGVGIDAADFDRLFTRFGQLDATRAKRHAGTGLGLSIVKSLVDQLGGHVEVKSEAGRGASFTVILPAARLGYETR